MIHYSLSLIIVLTIHIYTCESEINLSTLRFVQTLFRHGDRNPASTFKTDTKNNESTWKGGFGELSELGIQQQYQLGQFIKRRYAGFLSEKYNAKEIHVRSTGYNRTIMSALANLAGMFPPLDDQMWNKNLSWQPIPVHSKPREMDPELWMDKACPAVSDLYKNKVAVSEPYLKIERENKGFLDFLRVQSGRETLNLMDMWSIYDPLFCETLHNDTHERPDWVTDDVYNRMLELYRLSNSFYYNLPEIQRFRGSSLFNEIASRMMAKVTNESAYIVNLKYFAYSIHDTTQIALLENIQAYDGSLAPYDQVLLFELHQQNDTFIIKLFKRNDTRSEKVIPINLTACGDPCDAKTFFAMSRKNVPTDWDQECIGAQWPASTSVTKNTIIGILGAVSLVFFLLFLIMLALYIRQRRSASYGGLMAGE